MIFRQQEKTKKRCVVCEVVIAQGDIVSEAISSAFRGKVNSRLTHLSCMLKSAKALPTKEEYALIYDDWLISQV
jgi:hypothetical protein